MVGLPPLYAHRFGRDKGPDSSRRALKRTLAGPVDGLETDVCLTADGRVAVIHDPWLSLGTTARGWAHETDWETIGASFLRDRHGVRTAQQPMVLEDLWDEIPNGLPLQLEVKAHGDPDLAARTAEAVCDALQERPERHGVEVISFHRVACEVAAARGEDARLVVWSDMPVDALLDWAIGHGVGGVCVEPQLLHARLVEDLRLGGLSVTSGTINELEIARRVTGLGVDAITTDRPGLLRSADVAARAEALAG
ncbi:glycerophosphodiester phosphodiesterase [Patulibacter sp.]|uniref:glycerophosphodiester phosphodiesterase n=1 Tax=Patulibacter sp. TaxID=1912859 RepID=UPI002720EF4C|nr:glycerophosphodiester phosphodiesterase [Patulibacter sp.]MDO9410060.1 glycerophosphodiester phosphodiesterase [Patulibacter sp.]